MPPPLASRPGCLGRLFAAFLKRPDQADAPASRKAVLPPPKATVSTKFVTPAELNFYRVLTGVLAGRGHVLAQVALNRVLFLPKQPGRQSWSNKLRGRSLDFVVCDPATLRPLVVIELDDSTHDRPDRQARDEDVERLLSAAGLPFVRFKCRRTYHTQSVADAVLPHLDTTGPSQRIGQQMRCNGTIARPSPSIDS